MKSFHKRFKMTKVAFTVAYMKVLGLSALSVMVCSFIMLYPCKFTKEMHHSQILKAGIFQYKRLVNQPSILIWKFIMNKSGLKLRIQEISGLIWLRAKFWRKITQLPISKQIILIWRCKILKLEIYWKIFIKDRIFKNLIIAT